MQELARFVLRPAQSAANLLWREFGILPAEVVRQLVFASTAFGLLITVLWLNAGGGLFSIGWPDWAKQTLVTVLAVALVGNAWMRWTSMAKPTGMHDISPYALATAIASMAIIPFVILEDLVALVARVSGQGAPLSLFVGLFVIGGNVIMLNRPLGGEEGRTGGSMTARRIGKGAFVAFALSIVTIASNAIWMLRTGELVPLLCIVFSLIGLVANMFRNVDIPPGQPRVRHAMAGASA